ncbi:MAG: hypothetical protein JSV89_09045 [Spirochaetaceae bacterium]|nr:MAG: hypothetical protein JSV89_09045 [Spirochaetaceae bacterium]
MEHILITHTHSDHFQFEELVSKSQAIVDNGKPLHIYMSNPAKLYLESVFHTFAAQIEEEDDLDAFKKKYPVHGLEYYQEYEIGGLIVETIKGSHLAEGMDQFSCNYLIILPDGRRLLYAIDTGYYLDESWDFLRSRHTDILIMDCTFVGKNDGENHAFGHHTLNSFLKTLERMTELGFINEHTEVYATHFNPHQNLYHHEIQDQFDHSDFTVTAAFDGLRIY